MVTCPKCGAEVDEGVEFCPTCGEKLAKPVVDLEATDHTAEFDPKDISDNKVISMVVYLFGIVGVLVGLLAGVNSKYASFHVREALKIEVLSGLVLIATCLLSWTLIVPVAAGVFAIILFVVKIIAFIQVCKGQAKELPVVKSFKFLK